jgi:hypothetical protein
MFLTIMCNFGYSFILTPASIKLPKTAGWHGFFLFYTSVLISVLPVIKP